MGEAFAQRELRSARLTPRLSIFDLRLSRFHSVSQLKFGYQIVEADHEAKSEQVLSSAQVRNITVEEKPNLGFSVIFGSMLHILSFALGPWCLLARNSKTTRSSNTPCRLGLIVRGKFVEKQKNSAPLSAADSKRTKPRSAIEIKEMKRGRKEGGYKQRDSESPFVTQISFRAP